METKDRLLWVGDAVATTGFARVGHAVLENLKTKYDVGMIGINYFGDPHKYDYPIFPARNGGDLFGIMRLAEVINTFRPDALFMVNDPWNISFYLQELKNHKISIPVIAYFPVDGLNLSPMWFELWDEYVKETVVYTNFGYKEFRKAHPSYPEERITIIPHGVDKNVFFPMSTQEARKLLFKELYEEFADKFIILNANRNQPRKRVELSIWGFSRFAVEKDDVKLYLHMGMQDEGIDVLQTIHNLKLDDKIIITSAGNSIPGVSTERLNLIYNACDVGINTSLGEGWGLVSWEHGSVGKPQIVPANSASAELWQDMGLLMSTGEPVMNPRINTIGFPPLIDSVAIALDTLYESWSTDKKLYNSLSQITMDTIGKEEYQWKAISERFYNVIERALKN